MKKNLSKQIFAYCNVCGMMNPCFLYDYDLFCKLCGYSILDDCKHEINCKNPKEMRSPIHIDE